MVFATGQQGWPKTRPAQSSIPVQRMPFSNIFDKMCRAAPIIGRRLESMLLLFSILFLAACGQQGGSGYVEYGAPPPSAPMHYYPPPGPPGDLWGPYIREAATRYGVPEQWIRAVMQQESGGQEQAVSPVGAMGLMQVMPATYDGLRERYGLGDDPYDPHNNILAGTAYIREMYDKYGAPGFLAAYNAGPDRVDDYLSGASSLPNETVNYLAAVTPNLGDTVPFSGPLATYGVAHSGRAIGATPDVASLAAGCDLNRAYDPNHPCSSLMRVASAPAPVRLAFVPQTGLGGCDLSAAYDPSNPCTSVGQATSTSASPTVQPQQVVVRQATIDGCDPNIAYDPDRPCQAASAASPAVSPPMEAQRASAVTALASYQPATPIPSAEPGGASPHLLAIPDRGWAIQVGAFANPGLARAVAEGARAEAPNQLRSAALALPPTPYGGSVLYRARLVHLSASAASDACWQLNQRQLPCVVVQPNRS